MSNVDPTMNFDPFTGQPLQAPQQPQNPQQQAPAQPAPAMPQSDPSADPGTAGSGADAPTDPQANPDAFGAQVGDAQQAEPQADPNATPEDLFSSIMGLDSTSQPGPAKAKNEALREAEKKLPAWSLEPPAQYLN